MNALASEVHIKIDKTRWHALQTWLEESDHQVTIPYASALATLIPPVAVRLRRDFGALLTLIRGHAILQQAVRARDDTGRIVATLEDYGVVRELIADVVAEGVEATVPATMRETVGAIKTVMGASAQDVSIAGIARELKLDKAAASRRVRAALDLGFLKNQETKRGLPSRLVLGNPLPEEQPMLPTPEGVLTCCSENGGDRHPLPPLTKRAKASRTRASRTKKFLIAVNSLQIRENWMRMRDEYVIRHRGGRGPISRILQSENTRGGVFYPPKENVNTSTVPRKRNEINKGLFVSSPLVGTEGRTGWT